MHLQMEGLPASLQLQQPQKAEENFHYQFQRSRDQVRNRRSGGRNQKNEKIFRAEPRS